MSTLTAGTVTTPHDVMQLAELVTAVRKGYRVAIGDEDGNVVEGVARAFVVGPGNMAFSDESRDVRDEFVWLTMGFVERVESVSRLMELRAEGLFGIFPNR
jgi:hypothetical protein